MIEGEIIVKKIVAIVVMILMVLSNFKIIYADENIVVEKRSLENGNVELVLRVNESVQAYGGNITYSYDNTNMQISNIMVVNDENYIIVVNENYQNEGNKIRVVFAATKPIQGDLILIEFKPLNNGQIDSDGITVDQVELTNDGGIGIEGINQSTIQVENTKGDSLINNSVMKKYEDEAIDKQEENNETEASKQDASDVKNNHEKKEDKKAQNESLNINFIIGIGAIIVVVVVAIIVIFKKKVKK